VPTWLGHFDLKPSARVYFFLVSNLICCGHERRLFEMPGFNAQVGGETKCARLKAEAEEEMAELLSAHHRPGICASLHLFQPMRVLALQLPGYHGASQGGTSTRR